VMSEPDKKLVAPLTGAFVAQLTTFDKKRIINRLTELSDHTLQTHLKRLSPDPEYDRPLVDRIDAKPVR
jgi:hypothetical protein